MSKKKPMRKGKCWTTQEVKKLIKAARPEEQRSLYFYEGQRVEAYNDALDDYYKALIRKVNTLHTGGGENGR